MALLLVEATYGLVSALGEGGEVEEESLHLLVQANCKALNGFLGSSFSRGAIKGFDSFL